jgi:hypothetical protein
MFPTEAAAKSYPQREAVLFALRNEVARREDRR